MFHSPAQTTTKPTLPGGPNASSRPQQIGDERRVARNPPNPFALHFQLLHMRLQNRCQLIEFAWLPFSKAPCTFIQKRFQVAASRHPSWPRSGHWGGPAQFGGELSAVSSLELVVKQINAKVARNIGLRGTSSVASGKCRWNQRVNPCSTTCHRPHKTSCAIRP